jgi:hypothetical protein
MTKIKMFTITFKLHDQDLVDALSHDDNFMIAVEQMKINFAYELYLMCNEQQRKTAFNKDGCVTASVTVNEDDYNGVDYA